MTVLTMGVLPQFLGLGTQKGGTTTLQRLLEQHPQVWLSPSKELQFFTLHYGLGESWYRQQFKSAAAGKRCGDITPYYLFHPEAPARIAHFLLIIYIESSSHSWAVCCRPVRCQGRQVDARAERSVLVGCG